MYLYWATVGVTFYTSGDDLPMVMLTLLIFLEELFSLTTVLVKRLVKP